MSSRPSRTAEKIARFMILLDAIPRLRGVLPPDTASTIDAILRNCGAVKPGHIDMMRKPGTTRFYELAEGVTGRGQLLWFGVRKRWMHEQVEAAISAGAKQLLVVGAGFDALAINTARKHPEVLCVEIDAPPTADPKRQGIAGAGLARENHVICSADLAERKLEDVLKTTPWRTDARSVVVAEGLLMYLPEAAVTGFFSAVRASCGEGSRVAFTSLDRDEQGRPRVGNMNRSIQFVLRLVGEPMHWGVAPREVPQFLSGLGFEALEQPSMDALRSRFLNPQGLHEEPLMPYEHLVLAGIG